MKTQIKILSFHHKKYYIFAPSPLIYVYVILNEFGSLNFNKVVFRFSSGHVFRTILIRNICNYSTEQHFQSPYEITTKTPCIYILLLIVSTFHPNLHSSFKKFLCSFYTSSETNRIDTKIKLPQTDCVSFYIYSIFINIFAFLLYLHFKY